jgi:hypothetical protein
LSCLTKFSSVFPLICILSLSSEILSSTCSSLLEWPSNVCCCCCCCLTIGTFYFQDLCLIFSSEFFHLCSTLLLLFTVHFNSCISLFMVSFVPLWCLLRSSLSSFICYLCHLTFFIFGVLKFLECILYILVNHV